MEVVGAGLRFGGVVAAGSCRCEGLLVERVLTGGDADFFALRVWLACSSQAQEACEHEQSERVASHGVCWSERMVVRA